MNELQVFLVELELNPSNKYTAEEIKKQYYKLCKLHHPDIGGDGEKLKRINHAYAMLTDPSYRAKATENQVDLTVRMNIAITLEEAVFGKIVTITYSKFELSVDKRVPILKETQDLVVDAVMFPAGQVNGFTHGIRGGGIKMGENIGDALIEIRVLQHQRYKTDGIHIMTDEHVDLELMLTGGEIHVQTLYGIRTVWVPSGSGPGTQIMVPSCGVTKRSPHIIVIHPVFPTKEDLKSKKKFNTLDVQWAKTEAG